MNKLVLEAKNSKIKYLGEAKYFSSDYKAGDDADSERAKQTAYRLTIQPSANSLYLQETYERTGSKGSWMLAKKAEKISWKKRSDDGIYDLTKID